MNLIDSIGGVLAFLIYAYLLYRQNQIMEEQNRIMREQAGAPSVAAVAIPRSWLSQHWPMLVMGVLTLATWTAIGLFFYFRKPTVIEKIIEKPPTTTSIPAGKPIKKPDRIHTNPIAPSKPKEENGQSPPSTVINAPQGIGISGGNVNNPTVNNFGPLPVQFHWSVRDIVPPRDDDDEANPSLSKFKYEKEVTVNVSAPYTPVSIGIICDSHLEKVHAFLKQITMALDEAQGIDTSGEKAYVYFAGSPATPDEPLIIHIWANQPFSVLQVGQAKINRH
jgi:hypothetical protein